MTGVDRRSVLAGAAASALAQPAAAIEAPRGESVVFISDVHIGNNTPTVWYQKAYHEPFLAALLDYVTDNAPHIRELVILGDFVDFWTYPPHARPPSFAEIAADNPAVFAPGGKLDRALKALDGRASYVLGNHDMQVTQQDLDSIGSGGRQITLRSEQVYFPLGEDRRLACAHGHDWTLFNAPDPSTPIAPLPLGHFVTRSFCYMLEKRLSPGQTVADLPNQGAPNGLDLKALAPSISGDVVDTALNYVTRLMDIPEDEPIVLASGRTTSIREARAYYHDLWSRWVRTAGGGVGGEMVAGKAGLADATGDYLSWFAQRLGVAEGADLVVFGHTHTPISGLKGGFIQYVNTGFDCPSRADFGTKHPTFIEVDVAALKPQLRQVALRDGRYLIEDYGDAGQDSITYGPTQDFSTYVTIDNRGGSSDFVLTDFAARHGRYVVPPPAKIARGQTARLWIQDLPGLEGSSGSAAYRGRDGREVSLAFGCPTGLSANFASGAVLRSRSGDGAYGPPGHIASRGHPFFVEFSL